MQSAGFYRLLNSAANEFRRSQMGTMRLHDNWTSCREGGRRVAAGHRVKDRKVAGAKNSNRSERHFMHTHVWLRRRLALGSRCVDGGLAPPAFAYDLRKHIQLRRSAQRFTFD